MKMKKYKVLIECIYGSPSHEFCTEEDDFIKHLVKHGWLAEVPEEKELWEKLMGVEPNEIYYAASEKYWKDKSKIARQHFAEVAKKAKRKWHNGAWITGVVEIDDYIIQAIEKDGEA